MGENNTSLPQQVWFFVRISVYKILHRHLVVLLLLDDILVSFWKRKLAHLMIYQALKTANVPRVQENSGRVHLALSCIGWPVLSRDEQRAWGTLIKAEGGKI